MSRRELIAGLAIVVALVIAQSPGWTVSYVSNTDNTGITSVAQHSQQVPEMAIFLARNDDPPPHKRGDDPPRRGDDPPPHG